MGYSCTAKANNVLKFILEDICSKNSSNSWEIDGVEHFFEMGKENADGAITGSVHKINPDGVHCKNIGGVRIEPCGKVTRFPSLPKSTRQKIKEELKKGSFNPPPLIRYF